MSFIPSRSRVFKRFSGCGACHHFEPGRVEVKIYVNSLMSFARAWRVNFSTSYQIAHQLMVIRLSLGDYRRWEHAGEANLNLSWGHRDGGIRLCGVCCGLAGRRCDPLPWSVLSVD